MTFVRETEMHDTILVPTDGSAEAESAADYAIELAADLGASVHFLYVVELRPVTLPSEVTREPQRKKEHREWGREMLSNVADRAAPAGVGATTETRTGKAHEEIVESATERAVDAIVMGASGQSSLKEFLIGGTTERVIRLTKIPVTTVRA
ncbi:MAG: universal stress protein UspA related nucleotide-binding protein [uncultured archaeon A07HR67]|nr:MAG: universal stress protein UspA related nucleotide-binding protein [uncultured archaeon A07HR67]